MSILFRTVRYPLAALQTVLLCWAVLLMLGCSRSGEIAPYDTRANRDFTEAANRPPTQKTIYAMALLLTDQQRYAESDRLLATLLEDDREFLPAYNLLARNRIATNQTDAALQTLEVARQLNPADPVVNNNLGLCMMMKNNYQEAHRYFSAAVEAAPHITQYRQNQLAAASHFKPALP